MTSNFVEFYNAANKSQLEREAMEYLVTDTLQKNLKGIHKSKQLTAMNMESFAPAVFVPTMFYTFMYNSPTDDDIKGFVFKDRVPLILCLEYKDGYVSGINFNLIPCDIRAGIIDKIININKSFYEDDIENAIADHKFVINKILANLLSQAKGFSYFLYSLDAYTGLKISNCFRIYKEEYVVNPRLIEYDMWKYIPFLTFKDAIRGASLAKLQEDLVNDSIANK